MVRDGNGLSLFLVLDASCKLGVNYSNDFIQI